jgi:hypothetical protein
MAVKLLIFDDPTGEVSMGYSGGRLSRLQISFGGRASEIQRRARLAPALSPRFQRGKSNRKGCPYDGAGRARGVPQRGFCKPTLVGCFTPTKRRKTARKKDVKNEGCSGDVYENKGPGVKITRFKMLKPRDWPKARKRQAR